MTNRIILSVIGAFALVAGPSVRADDAVTLARTYKEGVVTHYKLTGNASVGGNEAAVTQTRSMKVKEVKKDGNVVLVVTNEGGHVSIGGMEMDIPASPPETETRDKVGKLVDFQREEAGQALTSPEVARLIAALSEILLPEKPVKAGDDWTTELDNPAVKDKKVKVKDTFVGIEKVDGTDLWKIKQTAEADTDGDGGKASYEMTSWLDPATGQKVKSEFTVKDLPTQFGAMTMTMKMETVKAEEKKAEK